MKTENIALGILVLLIIGIVFISGCVQEEGPGFVEEECRVEDDCPDKTCFTKDCIDYNCSYSQIEHCCGNEICEIGESYPECADCPDCNDGDKCTEDSFDYEQQACVNEKIVPCCGNGICEAEETYLTCLEDCPKTYEDELEEKIPEIKEYPKLGQVFADLYADDGFSDSEIKYVKALFEIFKSKTNLHQADEEVLTYLVTDIISAPHVGISKAQTMDMEYFVEEVIPLANDITKESSGEMESIEKIVSWTRENIKVNWAASGHDNMPKGILEYKEVTSPCDYWSTIINALCRASGIPARKVAGGFAESGPGHNWVEAYVNGEWVMVYSTGWLKSNPGKKNCLHSVYIYDQLNDRLMDVSLSYNREVLNLIIEHTKEVAGETTAVKQAEEIFTEYEKETGLAKRYAFAQEIMEICVSEVIVKQDGYESKDIKVLDFWDWDKLKKDEAFLSELEKAEVISVYDVTAKGFIQYRTIGSGEFPLEKINTTIPEIKQLFQGKIYFFFAHYKADCDPLSDVVVINLFNPEDVDTLEMAYQNLLTGTPELLKNFVIEIDSVVSKEKNYATFHLPEYIREGTEYSIITSSAWEMENTAWNIFFQIQSMVTIQDIVMVFRAGQTSIMLNLPDLAEDIKTAYNKWRGFDNLKLINKEGKIYVDPEIYRNPQFNPNDKGIGVPYDCAPSSVFISPGQTLEIYSEDDLVIIKGDMSTEQIVVS